MIPLVVVFALSCAFVAGERRSFENYKVLSVLLRNEGDVKVVKQLEEDGADLWTPHLYANANASLLVSPELQHYASRLLRKHAIEHWIVNENIQAAIDDEMQTDRRSRRSAEKQVVGTFARYDAIESWLQSTAAACGDLCVLENIGRSYERRNLYVMRIGENIKSGAVLPRVFTDSTLHAREWLAQAAHIWAINQMIFNRSNAALNNALKKYEYNFVVVANPDGYEYTHEKDRLWRKTRSSKKGTECVGVDPNRNFNFSWAGEGTSSNPCKEIYFGPKPFSEPETQALSNYILANKNQIRAYIALHTYCQMILVPYGHTTNVYPADYDELLRVAQAMSAAIRGTTGKVYQAGNTAALLSPGAGGSDDWAKGTAGIKYSYTIELRPTCSSRNGFVVSPSEIAPAGTELLAVLTTLAEEMRIQKQS